MVVGLELADSCVTSGISAKWTTSSKIWTVFEASISNESTLVRKRKDLSWDIFQVEMGASGCAVVSNLDEQTYTSEFEFPWNPYSHGLVPYLMKSFVI